MWIELTGLYTADEVDYESLGIDVNESDAEPSPTLVNMDNVAAINEASEGRTTLQYSNGERVLFKDKYEDVKDKINT